MWPLLVVSTATRAAIAARRVVGASAVARAADEVVLAETLAAQGRDDEARDLLDAALTTYERTYGPNHHEVGVTLVHLGALDRRRDSSAALRNYTRALEIKQRTRGPHHPEVGAVHNNLGALHHEQGRTELAREHYEHALALLARRYGPDHPATLTCRANLARLESR